MGRKRQRSWEFVLIITEHSLALVPSPESKPSPTAAERKIIDDYVRAKFERAMAGASLHVTDAPVLSITEETINGGLEVALRFDVEAARKFVPERLERIETNPDDQAAVVLQLLSESVAGAIALEGKHEITDLWDLTEDSDDDEDGADDEDSDDDDSDDSDDDED